MVILIHDDVWMLNKEKQNYIDTHYTHIRKKIKFKQKTKDEKQENR